MGLQLKKKFANLTATILKATTQTVTTITATTLTATTATVTTGTITNLTVGSHVLSTKAFSATIVVGTEVPNDILVSASIFDATGTALAAPAALSWYLADDAAGLTRATTAPDGGVVAASGTISEYVANLAGEVTTTAVGLCSLTLTESGVATWYLVIVMPDGSLQISDAITFA